MTINLLLILNLFCDCPYYTSQCDEAQNLVVVVENNWGDLVEMEFDFNHADEESENEPKSSQPDKEGGA